MRFAGPDRYQTNLALNLALRGKGDFPFDTGDRTSGNAPTLAAAGDWWGAASCPRSIIVVAGDTFADALAAASLSDPTDRARGPRLRRVAAADPLFDPPGQLDVVENAFAPIVVTESGRAGATALAPSARVTAADLAQGGCTTAREAVIVGGTGAVPMGVEAELVRLGYDEVFRVAGSDRYETAAQVAAALGSQAPPAGASCVDGDANDGAELGFYGVGVAEYRFEPRSCILLSRAVVLADGGTGADALAAGWWTSRWQVPVLLTAPDGSLPVATQAALRTLDIDSVIVLGGLGRIPEATVDQAKMLAGAVAGRIAGADRYETSLEMARSFGGWFPTGDGASFGDDLLCVAASAGSGGAATGWGDALAAGPWCARLAEARVGSPERLLPSAAAGEPGVLTGGGDPAHRAAPILLVPTRGGLPASLGTQLRKLFDPTGGWCTSGGSPSSCLAPGFAAIVGGTGAVTVSVADELTDIVSGTRGIARGDGDPQLGQIFPTTLDLAPVYGTVGDGPRSVCARIDGLRDVRWLTASGRDRTEHRLEADLAGPGGAGFARGACLRTAAPVTVTGVSLAGVATASVDVVGPSTTVSLSAPIRQTAPAQEQPGTWRFDARPEVPVVLQGPGGGGVGGATLELSLRSTADGTATFTGVGSVSTSSSDVLISVTGTAVRLFDRWELAGAATVDARPDVFIGGFRASLSDRSATPSVSWQFDGWDQP